MRLHSDRLDERHAPKSSTAGRNKHTIHHNNNNKKTDSAYTSTAEACICPIDSRMHFDASPSVKERSVISAYMPQCNIPVLRCFVNNVI